MNDNWDYVTLEH